jgi:hypothetical protein
MSFNHVIRESAMKIDGSVKLGAALVSGCLAPGLAQASFAQTGSNPSTQHSKSAAKPGASLEESRTPDTTSANGNVGEAGARPMASPAAAMAASRMSRIEFRRASRRLRDAL